ncbi:MAG: DUF1295 domain-containing protein [Gammaproteobacteria bacterium]|nr:DUF1295 domain-containing protein [Gammaproteobacteria bacterium]MDE2251245.1 DUF1295 domain-containing protein [Gammaproteobacteria bacterium]
MPEPQLLHVWLGALAYIAPPAVACWLASLPLRDASIVDRAWSLLFVAVAVGYALALGPARPRVLLTSTLLLAWALRLSLHITLRNWGQGEDRRYRQIRRNHEPGFAWKSLYIVFGLQAVLVWVISLPLLGSMAGDRPPGWRDAPGLLLWLAGFSGEWLADQQLARFRRAAGNHDGVLDTGLWRYSRHPNYFGECCVWWGFYLLAASAGAWWTVPAPVLMTALLLRVSGVALLERDIGARRPAYREYVARTNAFLPGPRRAAR